VAAFGVEVAVVARFGFALVPADYISSNCMNAEVQTCRSLSFCVGQELAGNARFVIANISGYCARKNDPKEKFRKLP